MDNKIRYACKPMKDNFFSLSLSVILVAGTTSCGFKSDLYLLDQADEIGQFDTQSLKDRGDQELQQLKDQTGDPAEDSALISKEPVSGVPVVIEPAVEPAIEPATTDLPNESELFKKNSELKKKSEN